MRTGICTTDFDEKNLPRMTADDLFALIRHYGYACTQFAFSSIAESGYIPDGCIEIPESIAPSVIRAVERASAKHNLPVMVFNGTFNMAHPDEEIRQTGLKRLEVLADAADALGVKMISLCSGTRNPGNLWAYSDENDTDDAWNAMYGTMQRAAETAEKHGITLAIESEASNVISTPERARRLMDGVGSDKIKMILDCANLFHRGEAHPENVQSVITHAFEVYGHDIVIAHGKDIREGDGIDFCGTGDGIVDFSLTAELLTQYGYAGDMFLHGIYERGAMVKAREHWEAARR
ncbi:MAG: sugar phosphate isomerase/epimerase [Clostridia bacterium]|nr:sugar phosphate isomerase/epimerase [Clostridia bacterium]